MNFDYILPLCSRAFFFYLNDKKRPRSGSSLLEKRVGKKCHIPPLMFRHNTAQPAVIPGTQTAPCSLQAVPSNNEQ